MSKSPFRPWRSLHQQSLQQNRPDLLRELSDQGRLESHLQAVGREAQEMFERISRDLKGANPSWTLVQIEKSAEETVMQDLVLVKDLLTEDAERFGYLD